MAGRLLRPQAACLQAPVGAPVGAGPIGAGPSAASAAAFTASPAAPAAAAIGVGGPPDLPHDDLERSGGGMASSATTNPPKIPSIQLPIDAPTRIEIRTSSGLMLTVLLMIDRIEHVVLDLGVDQEHDQRDDARRPGPWVSANSTMGIPASAPPIIGRKSTSATHSAHRNGNGTPEDQQRDHHDHARR